MHCPALVNLSQVQTILSGFASSCHNIFPAPQDHFLLRLEVSKQSVQPKTYKYWQHANVIVKAKRNRVNARIELRLTCQAGYMQIAVGCQMQIIAKKYIIAHSCTQETHRLQIIAHRRHSLHCIGGSCMLQGSRQPFKSSRISNLDQTNSLSRFTSYKWFEDICSQDINFCGYWLLESSWAISSPATLALQTLAHL